MKVKDTYYEKNMTEREKYVHALKAPCSVWSEHMRFRERERKLRL